MLSCSHAPLCIQPQHLGTNLAKRAAFPKHHVLKAVPGSVAAACAEMPSWAPPCAVAGCLICTVPICTSSWASLGGGMRYGEVQGVAGEIRR